MSGARPPCGRWQKIVREGQGIKWGTYFLRKSPKFDGHFWSKKPGQKNDNRLSVIIFLAAFLVPETAPIFVPLFCGWPQMPRLYNASNSFRTASRADAWKNKNMAGMRAAGRAAGRPGGRAGGSQQPAASTSNQQPAADSQRPAASSRQPAASSQHSYSFKPNY